jgi:hypothetical protein
MMNTELRMADIALCKANMLKTVGYTMPKIRIPNPRIPLETKTKSNYVVYSLLDPVCPLVYDCRISYVSYVS